jgi:hypothetical protein
MNGHRLRRQFYTAGDSEPAVRSQRVIGGAMAAARTDDAIRAPIDHFVDEAHAALVRYVPLDPRAVDR